MRRRAALAWLGTLPLSVAAQSDWRRVAVPLITPQAWLQSLDEHWYAPRSAAFGRAAEQLAAALRTGCVLAPARAAWRDTMLAWERLAAVQTGALIERKTARTLDFQPTRVRAIERAMAEPAAELALAGAPAQGLPALEWLLWRTPLQAGTPACAYAQRVAAALAAEAQALATAMATPRERDEDAQQRDFATLVNQLVGGVESLRWAQMGRPRQASGAGRSPEWPRVTSGLTQAAWAARAQALQSVLLYDGSAAGQGDASSLEALLRGRGFNPLADRLRREVGRMAQAVASAQPARLASVQAAEVAAGAVKHLLEADLAPQLAVSIGFSDADGD